jgi:peptide/nickel transport system permease protein
LTEEQIARGKANMIKIYHLDDPFLVQYFNWAKSLVQGTWGYSPTLHEDVLPALLRRTPATAELTIYSLLLFIPLGLVSGVLAGWRQQHAFDNSFRLLAFVSTSFPPFILALVLLSIFYVKLHWFAPGRIDQALGFQISDPAFRSFTGMYTLDALLNRRFDIFIDALRHLAMPVFTLFIYHWATLGRITRSTIISERHKDYLVAAQARGLKDRQVIWRHAFWNTLAPSLTSVALSAASLVTGVFVVEIIYRYSGVSAIILRAIEGVPDAPAALGFSVYSMLLVLTIMLILDILQAIFDPRIREDMLDS